MNDWCAARGMNEPSGKGRWDQSKKDGEKSKKENNLGEVIGDKFIK